MKKKSIIILFFINLLYLQVSADSLKIRSGFENIFSHNTYNSYNEFKNINYTIDLSTFFIGIKFNFNEKFTGYTKLGTLKSKIKFDKLTLNADRDLLYGFGFSYANPITEKIFVTFNGVLDYSRFDMNDTGGITNKVKYNSYNLNFILNYKLGRSAVVGAGIQYENIIFNYPDSLNKKLKLKSSDNSGWLIYSKMNFTDNVSVEAIGMLGKNTSAKIIINKKFRLIDRRS